MSGYGKEGPWSWWYVALWGLASLASLAAFFALRTIEWAAFTGVAFMVLETIGLLKAADGKPPLTFVIRRYVPRWFAFPALYFLVGSQVIAAVLVRELLLAAMLIGFIGWLTSHFDITYTEARNDGWPPKLPSGLTGDKPERKA